MAENGEVSFCDIEINLNDNSNENVEKLAQIIDDIGIPKGSFLKAEGLDRAVGTLEGLALYMNGTELPEDVYKTCDINHVVKKANELIAGIGKMYSHWQGPQDTALYFYGTSFADMKEKTEPFLAEYPLCQKCRVAQIA